MVPNDPANNSSSIGIPNIRIPEMLEKFHTTCIYPGVNQTNVMKNITK